MPSKACVRSEEYLSLVPKLTVVCGLVFFFLDLFYWTGGRLPVHLRVTIIANSVYYTLLSITAFFG